MHIHYDVLDGKDAERVRDNLTFCIFNFNKILSAFYDSSANFSFSEWPILLSFFTSVLGSMHSTGLGKCCSHTWSSNQK